MLTAGCGGVQPINGNAVSDTHPDIVPKLATPVAQSPAAGICAEISEDIVIVTINPDIPDPRCSVIHPEQKLEVINHREETLEIKIGQLEATLAPGESHLFDLAFRDYLAPGVHRIEVQPCCGAELVLGDIQTEE